jgi:hypothetical protein
MSGEATSVNRSEPEFLKPEVMSLHVTRLWWPVNIDIAIQEGEDGDEHVADRIQHVLDVLGAKVAEFFPNATDIDIAETDRFSPRFETEDGRDYEYGYETLTAWEDEALGEAMEKWPFLDDDDRTVTLPPETARAIRYIVRTTERHGFTYQGHLDAIEAWIETWDDEPDVPYVEPDPLNLLDSALGRKIAGTPTYTDASAGCDWCGVNDRIAGSRYCAACDLADRTTGLNREDKPDCQECGDGGVIAMWGTNDGCREFMTEPEISFCDCAAGQRERERGGRS